MKTKKNLLTAILFCITAAISAQENNIPWYALDNSRSSWGPDKRAEATTKWEYRNYVRATATAFPIWNVEGNYVYAKTLRDKLKSKFEKTGVDQTGNYNFDPGVRFLDQPAGGFCSGFLIAPDILVTACHCVDAIPLDSQVWIFDYTTDVPYIPSTRKLTLPKTNQYKAVELLDKRFGGGVWGNDFAIVRLDRPVLDRKPYKFRLNGGPNQGDFVATIGSPRGLPLKVTDSARVTNSFNTDSLYFITNLTAFHGNSGGPVFNQNGFIEGILVRGPKQIKPMSDVDGMWYDYHWDEASQTIKQDNYFDMMTYLGLPAINGTEVHRINKSNRYFQLYAVYRNLELAIINNKPEEFTEWCIYTGIWNIPLQDYRNESTNFENLLVLSVKYQRNDFTNFFMDQKSINFNILDINKTPLIHLIVKNNDLSILTNLINKAGEGLDINQKNSFGETALMLASKSGFISEVEALINAGADVKALNNEGKTARKLAKEAKQKDIAKMLKKAEKSKK